MNPTDLAFFVAGIVGTLVRILATPETGPIFTRKSSAELILGGVLGILTPLVVPVDAAATLVARSAMVFTVAYVGGDLLNSIITRAQGNVFKATAK